MYEVGFEEYARFIVADKVVINRESWSDCAEFYDENGQIVALFKLSEIKYLVKQKEDKLCGS